MESIATFQEKGTRPLSLQGRLRHWLPLIGVGVLRYGLVLILIAFGAQKWTAAEAQGIQPWMAHSPLTFWLYHVASVQGASILIGVVELSIALTIALRRFLPIASAWGSVAAAFMFLTTLSFLITTPNMDQTSQGFLIKDVFLLGGALVIAGEAFRAAERRTAETT